MQSGSVVKATVHSALLQSICMLRCARAVADVCLPRGTHAGDFMYVRVRHTEAHTACDLHLMVMKGKAGHRSDLSALKFFILAAVTASLSSWKEL